MSWKEQQTNKYKEWNKGETLEGVLVGKEENELRISNNTNKKVELIKATSMLKAGFKDVEVGDKVKIVYEGTKETAKGNTLMLFKVYKWSNEVVEETVE